MKAFQNHIPRIGLLVSLSAVYAVTLAPGLTWANGGADGGDLISAAATGGIPHPTGYPLYILLARCFQFLPLGSLAFRTSLMSALATVLAAWLVYEIVYRSTKQTNERSAWLGALSAGFTFGLAPLVWSQAVITEVYALQALLTVLAIYFYTLSGPVTGIKPEGLDRWRGLLLGLATGNHSTTLFLVPLAFFLGAVQRTRERDVFLLKNISLNWNALRRQLIFFGIGLSVYLILPLRAIAAPPINWGDPVTLERFWWLVSGQLYQAYYLPENLAGLWEKLPILAAFLIDQIGLLGLLLGCIGLVVYGKTSRLYALTIWLALVSGMFALAYRAADSYVYMIPVIIAFAIWTGLGISGLAHAYIARYSRLAVIVGLLLTTYYFGQAARNYQSVDASTDTRAEDFAREVLAVAPKDALVFARGDEAIFSLWYFHFALRERPDLVVIATDLLQFDWYQETLRTRYPALIVPGPMPYPETVGLANPSRPTCNVQYTIRGEIECLLP